MSERAYFVYRLLGVDGTPLYVGMTHKPVQRLRHHRGTKPWIGEVASVRMVGPLSKDDASDLERLLIRRMAPRFNHTSALPRIGARDVWNAVLTADLERVKAASA